MRVYDGSSWAAAGSAVNGTSGRFVYTATAGQTTFSGTDDNGATLAYDTGFIDVYLNGVKMVNGTDVTVTSGTSVVFASGVALNDIVEMITYGAFNLASFAATAITSGTLNTARIADGSITNAKLAGSITNAKLATPGLVVQMVHASTTSVASTTAASQTASNLTADITPSSTSNKIIVMMCTSIYHSSDAAQSSVTIFRDSTNLGRDDRGIVQFSDFEDRFQANATMILTDSPSTTSSVTYTLYFRNISTGMGTTYIGVDGTPQWITLLEVTA
tara:strand:+ start:844 stop:1665 length:822 start_codon:yes stop_codon:yes gene_type:complete